MAAVPQSVVCDTSSTGAQSRYAAEWGLASLILAGVMTLAALLMFMILVWLLMLIKELRPDRLDSQWAVGITAALTVICWAVTIIGVVAGWIGVRAAWARCQPGGLPVVGLVLSVLAFLLWTSVVFAVVMNSVDLSRRGVI